MQVFLRVHFSIDEYVTQQSIGFILPQTVHYHALNLQNNPSRTVSGSIGYNLRYWQWKSSIDTVHAAFRSGMAYQSWSAPIDGWDVLTSSGTLSYQSMKVRPQQLNSIFEPQVSGQNCSVAYDQLLCNVNFQVYAVQNLDRNGLPY